MLPWLSVVIIPFALWLYRIDKRLDGLDFRIASIYRYILDKKEE